jgi:uncharacterized protein (TIGR02001 family)
MLKKQSIILSLSVAMIACTIPALCLANAAETDSSLPSENSFPGTLTGNIGVVSDYIFRGISQTRENPALQGGVDYTHPSGFYSGLWGSSIDFNDTDNTHVEIDGYIGYIYNHEAWTLDSRITYYAYPEAKSSLNYDYYEIGINITHDFQVAKLTGSFNYTPENFGASGDATYYSLATTIPLPHGFNANGKIGHQTIDNSVNFGYPSYTDWSAGITYELYDGISLAAQYVDTNLSAEECSDGCDAKGVLSLTYSF